MKKRIYFLCIITSLLSIFILSCKNNTFEKYINARKKKIASDAIPPDTTPPDVYNVIATSNTTIRITFSELVDEETAIDASNYAIQHTTDNIPVLGAYLELEGTTVTLTVNPGMQHNTDYTMVVKNVKDLKDNAIDISMTPFKGRGVVYVNLENTPGNPTNTQDINITVKGKDIIAYKYKLDDSGSMSPEIEVSSNIVETAIAEGPHTLYVIGKDSFNNWQPISNATTFTWTIDLSPPIAVLNNLPINPTNSTGTSIAVAGSQVVEYKYKIDGGNWTYPISISHPISESDLEEGEHTVHVIGKDQAGNWQDETSPSSYTWNIDISAPTVELTNTPANPTNETSISITVGGVQVTQYKYKIDSGSWIGPISISSKIEESNIQNGNHTLKVVGMDESGNWQKEDEATTYTWEIDTIPPIAVISNLPPDPTKQTEIDIVVSGTDVIAYKYRLDGSQWSSENSNDLHINASGLSEDSHSIEIIGKDNVGNWQTEDDATVYTWEIDTSATTAVLSSLPHSITNLQSANINVEGEDVQAYKYKLDDGNWNLFEINESINIVLSEFDLSEGQHTIYVIARDSAYNWQSELNATSYTWEIDTTPPTAILTNTPANPTNVQSTNISVSGDQVIFYRYRIDTGAWSEDIPAATDIIESGLTVGSHTVEVVGKDQAGNWQDNALATNYTWTIDIEPPTAIISNLPENPTSNQIIDIDVSGPGVSAYKYQLDGNGWSTEINAETNIFETGLSEGPHTINVIGRDSAGNWQEISNPTTYSWIIDITAPTALFNKTPNDPSNNTGPIFGVTGHDVIKYKYRLDNSGWSGLYDVSKPITLNGLTSGTHTIEIIGKDQAGNEQAEQNATSFTWSIDLSAPIAEITGLPTDPTNIQTININVMGTDVISYMYKIDNESWSGEIPIANPITRSYIPEGTRSIYVIGKDEAGNWQPFVDATFYSWEIDITPPSVVLSNTPVNPTNQTSISIQVNGTDIISYKYKLDSNDWSVEIDKSIIISESSLTQNSHTILVIGKDLAGNWQEISNATSFTWFIDLDAPTALISNTPDNPTNIQDLDIDVSGTDVTSYSYNIDDSGWSNEVDASINITESALPEGTHSIEIIAKDSAGNWQDEENATTYTWEIDITPPTALLFNTPDNPTSNLSANINVGGNDVIFYKFQLDNGGWSENLSIISSIELSLETGEHTIEVVGLDSAGNWQDYANASTYTWQIDQTPPDVPIVSDTGDYDSDQELYFFWNISPEVSEVKIQISTDSTFSNILLGGIDGKSINTDESYTYYMDPNNGPSYYARIKVRDKSNNWSDWGTPSDGINVVGSISGKVLDTTLSEISGATIQLKRTSDDTLINTTNTDSNGNFIFSNVPIGNIAYYIEAIATGYYSAAKNNISSNVGINTDIGIIYLVSTTALPGTITGSIVDANDGRYVNGTTIIIRDWFGNIADTQTPADNSFTTTQLTPGTYTIIVSKEGYFDLTIDNKVIDGNIDVGRLALCGILTEPQVRVIVQWGQTPYDLDLHVVGPTDYAYTQDIWWDGDPVNRFHVYWQNHKSYDENTGFYSRNADPDGFESTTSLVQDDTSSWGPEAINLFGYGTGYDNGIYTFTVHQYRESTSETWYDYAVTMRVFDSQGLVQEIPVPNGANVGVDDTDFFWKAIKINIQGEARNLRTIMIENTFAQFYYSTKSDLNW